MALKRRRAEASKDAANEYAQLLAKRVNEEKAKKTELRSMSISHPCFLWLGFACWMVMANLYYRATSELDEEVGMYAWRHGVGWMWLGLLRRRTEIAEKSVDTSWCGCQRRMEKSMESFMVRLSVADLVDP